MTDNVRHIPMTDTETRRLAAVHRYDILDTPPDGAFERITAIAAQIFSVPISIISLVDHDRIWFKSHHGLEVQQIDREAGLCASAILQEDPWILTDAKKDVRSLTNPLVAGDFGLRFYAGVPLRTEDGFNLGTLCVIDREPRPITEQQIRILKDLAAIVMDEMELRLSARQTVAELKKTLAEKDVMAAEIEHRVMNSLQLVSSILRLQSKSSNKEAAEQLSEAAARVTAVARVHQHLYMTGNVEQTECEPYLRRLSKDLLGFLPGGIEVESEHASVPTAQIISIGLIVTELLTNAAKQGATKALVGLRATEGKIHELRVEDDGRGLPEDFDPAASRGLGMKVILSLSERLGGTLSFGKAQNGSGARFTIAFEQAPERLH